MIFRESELADRFYLIETGKVILESSDGLGDPLLGWSWMFPPHIWNFTARAVEPTTAIFFDGAILREYCEKDHSLGYELLKRMSLVMNRRMQAARNKMLAIHHRSDALQPGGAAAVHPGAQEPNGDEDSQRKFSERAVTALLHPPPAKSTNHPESGGRRFLSREFSFNSLIPPRKRTTFDKCG